MKKIEIENIITDVLHQNNFTFVDLLNSKINIDSYERYVETFKLIESSFKDDITEFVDEAKKYLEKIEQLISAAQSTSKEQVQNFIITNIRKYIAIDNYPHEIHIRAVFISSLDNSLERSEAAIKLIYKELGFEKLLSYIELLKFPQNLTSYLNDAQKQQIAMHYILFKTGHHSTSTLSRNKTAKNLYSEMKNNIDETINDIVSEKNDYINFMNEEKEKINAWFESENEKQNAKDEEYKNFMADCNEKIKNLENTYSEKLKISEPADFMRKKSNGYLISCIIWALASTLMIIIMMYILGKIINPRIIVGKKVIEITVFSKQIPVYQSIIFLSIVGLTIYILRVFIKLTISSKHLSEEYKQKYILTYFYLSLISTGKLDNELGNSILAKLFTKADTGLIKNDSSVEMESIYNAILTMSKS